MQPIPFPEAPPLIQVLIAKVEPFFERFFDECLAQGKTDIVLDIEMLDPDRVRVSSFTRTEFRGALEQVDPESPFVEKLGEELGSMGFWASVRVKDDHYLYPIILSERLN